MTLGPGKPQEPNISQALAEQTQFYVLGCRNDRGSLRHPAEDLGFGSEHTLPLPHPGSHRNGGGGCAHIFVGSTVSVELAKGGWRPLC